MARHGKQEAGDKPPGRIKRIGKWGWGAILVAIGSVITLGLTSAAPNLFNAPAAGDAIRSGDVPAFVKAFAPGDALNITLGRIKDINGSWSVAFPRTSTPAATPFMIERPYEDINAYSVMHDELKAGAYAVDGVRMEVTVEGRRNQEINILNIHPAKQREPLVDGPSIYMGTAGGGATEHISYDLDKPQPEGQEVDYESADPTPHAFFDEKRVTLKNGETDTFTLDLSAIVSAYSFVVDFDYEVGGQKFTQTLDLEGQPFRVTPSLCSRPIDTDHPIPASVLKERATRRYSDVVFTYANEINHTYSVLKGTPQNFCSDSHQTGNG